MTYLLGNSFDAVERESDEVDNEDSQPNIRHTKKYQTIPKHEPKLSDQASEGEITNEKGREQQYKIMTCRLHGQEGFPTALRMNTMTERNWSSPTIQFRRNLGVPDPLHLCKAVT